MPRREVYVRFLKIPLEHCTLGANDGWCGPIVTEDGEDIKRIERRGQWIIVQIQTPIRPPTDTSWNEF